MDITRRDVGPVTVLDLVGRLTGTDSHGTLKQQVTELVTDGRKHIVLNLEKLSYMDSGGLGEMVSCYTTASKAGGAVKLAHLTTRIKDLLMITKLVTVFDSFDTEAGAVASFPVSS
jgi:anti-sigma B factor antagonist